MSELKILLEQPTQEKPYIVENYPYGYTQRTTIRYWVETTKNGQRFVSQTLNPKTQLWNKEKKGTYSQIILVGLTEENHVSYTCLSLYSLEEALRFKEKYEKFLNEYQLTELKNIIKMSEVYDKVEYTIKARKFRHIVTGEITESIDIMHLNEYEEINEDGSPVDEDREKEKRKESNIAVNKAAVLNASTGTSLNAALKTFKRIKKY